QKVTRWPSRAGPCYISSMALALTPGQLDAIRAHAARTAPAECCGLLLGAAGEGGARVVRLLPTANQHATPQVAYRLDPEVVARALVAARHGGPAVVGVYHSHPRGAPLPRPTDEAEAWPGWSYLIVGGEGWQGRSF